MAPFTSVEKLDSQGISEVTTKTIDVESAPVEEVSALPPATGGTSSSQKKAPAAPAATSRASANEAKSKSASEQAAEREEELQRLKAQAYSETQKDRLGSTPPAKPSTEGGTGSQSSSSRDRAASVKRVDLSQAVAECNNEVGLFYQERCKWRLCNGRWGKYGCPSYQHDSRAHWHIS